MKIKTETYLKAVKGEQRRLVTCLVMIIITMIIVFAMAIDCMRQNHKKQLDKTRKQTEQQIYQFLTR